MRFFLVCLGLALPACSSISDTGDLPPGTRDGGGGGGRDGGPPGSCARTADCDDGNPCNGEETCTPSGCVGGAPMVCDDGIDCTRDRCEDDGCRNDPQDDQCNAAPGGDCEADGCHYPSCDPAECDDGNECTDDDCGDSGCVNEPHARGCDDGDPCTVADVCGDGACSPGDPAFCPDDDNPCTAEACADGECRSLPVPMGTSCGDHEVCTSTARCVCA